VIRVRAACEQRSDMARIGRLQTIPERKDLI
jgi:hypothetical protein